MLALSAGTASATAILFGPHTGEIGGGNGIIRAAADCTTETGGVVDELCIERAHYWGYSMGASNGWAMGMLRPDRLVSLVLGGYPALPSPASERDRVKWESRVKLMRLGMDVYIAAMEMDRGPMPEENKRRLMANDGHAYAAQQLANITWGTPESAVRAMTVPALVYSGTEDDYPLPGNHW